MAKTGTSKPKRAQKEETTEEFVNRITRLKKQAGTRNGLKRRTGQHHVGVKRN